MANTTPQTGSENSKNIPHHHSDTHDHGYDNHHEHDDGHEHNHIVTANNERRIRSVFIFTAGYALIQAVGGWLSGSLALIADSGHMVSDAVGSFLKVSSL